MSKKSRRRNQAILAALVGGLALANRGKGMENANISVDSGRGSGLRPTIDSAGTTKKVKPAIKPKRSSILAKPGINRMDLSEVDMDYMAPDMSEYRNMDMGLEGYYKKGGRVKKTKKGGRAVRKANRSKKK